MRSLLLLTLMASAASAGTPGVTITQPSDPAVTEGDVTIDGEPAANFALVQDYRKWTEIMPDVAKVEISEQKGVDARVTLVSPSGHRDNLHFHNTPQANLIFFEDTGRYAETVSERITAKIRELAMPNAKFSISIRSRVLDGGLVIGGEPLAFSGDGVDEVEMLLSAHSGGALSLTKLLILGCSPGTYGVSL